MTLLSSTETHCVVCLSASLSAQKNAAASIQAFSESQETDEYWVLCKYGVGVFVEYTSFLPVLAPKQTFDEFKILLITRWILIEIDF